MPGFGPLPSDWRTRFDSSMSSAATLYADAISVVAQITGDAAITQLGGMTLAIESIVEGHYLRVFDADDSLPWDRDEDLHGWMVAVFPGRPGDEWTDPVATGTVYDPDVAALAPLVREVLAKASSQRRPNHSV
jgi:hypothetical protein